MGCSGPEARSVRPPIGRDLEGSGVELPRQFGSRLPQIGGVDEHAHRADVDDGDLDLSPQEWHVDGVSRMPRRQKPAGCSAAGARIVKGHLRTTARNAIDLAIALDTRLTVGALHQQSKDLAGIRVVHAHFGDGLPDLDQLLLQCVHTGRRRDVAADHLIADRRCIDTDLGKRVVDVRVRARRRPDDGALAGQDVGAAESVDLSRVGAPKESEQQALPAARIAGHVPLGEKHRLAGAATHDDDGDSNLFAHALAYLEKSS